MAKITVKMREEVPFVFTVVFSIIFSTNMRMQCMHQYLPHEKLDVYATTLTFMQLAAPLIDAWPPMVSVRNQFDRATESLLTNLVRAVRLRRTDQGIYSLECSLGSVLECSACLDVARVRRLIEEPLLLEGKQTLLTIARMQVGLRTSWRSAIHEENAEYAAQPNPTFPHESLHVYQRALQLYTELMISVIGDEREGNRYARRADEAGTSLILNIAEGNGRFSHLDHRRFVDAAEDAGTKLAAHLDLMAAAWNASVGHAKLLLREVMAMLAGLRGYLESGGRSRS